MLAKGLCLDELVDAVYREVARERGAEVWSWRHTDSVQTHHLVCVCVCVKIKKRYTGCMYVV